MMKIRSAGLCISVGMIAACASAPNATRVIGAQPAAISSNALELRQGMRDLWADHVVWTRAYIVAAVADDPSASSALARLMRNQEELGSAIAPYYGGPAGARLTALLKEHISIAGELVGAAKARDDAKVKGADARWHRNAEEIATFLSEANPNWNRGDLVRMLNEHLALTTQEATLRLQKNWREDTATFDRIYDQAMMMADALSDGVIRQFPARF
jgi:hypothetical protein